MENKPTVIEIPIKEWPELKDIRDNNCMHMQCTECHGSGTKKNGSPCVHFLSCPCTRCTPRF